MMTEGWLWPEYSSLVSVSMAPDVDWAMRLIDEAHALDPNRINVNDGNPDLLYELYYTRKYTTCLEKHTPNPTMLLVTAVKAQHFRRREIPRSSYSATKPNYLA
jgi:hypothetical protein